MKTNLKKVSSRFLGFALVWMFVMTAFNVNAQITDPKEAIPVLQTEVTSLETYFQQKYPQYPNVDLSILDNGDWLQGAKVNAARKLIYSLQDSREMEMEQEIAEVAKQGVPRLVNGVVHLSYKNDTDGNMTVFLDSYLKSLLGL